MIEAAETHASDGRVHIVAPPGAGKTVMGVELARFFGRPAVAFAPTTTIQDQWIETVGMFTDELTPELVSDDPGRLAAFNAYTYQLISTQDHADEDFAEAAVRLWAESIVDEGRGDDVEASLRRIAEIRENNPSWYRQEVARYRKDLRRRMLREDPAALGSILHPNARQLVENLVAAGVGTVVLDECHHLLDYWALVVRYLVSRIEEPAVIGLTATPAAPETTIAEENYFALLGDVDFEVPTPALVRERTLAPYRDLVRFVRPTAEELDFLRELDERLAEAVGELTSSARFRDWLHGALFGEGWTAAVASDALFAFSGLRVLLASGARPPAGVEVPEIATHEPQLEDWMLVVERFALDVLAVSADPSDHVLQRTLKSALKPFGITLTERGVRRGRSAVDRIVALSDAKAAAVVEILRLEREALGSRLCAAVVCDFDREQAGADVAGSLRAGSARGVHGVLAGDADLAAALAPTLVTAAGVAVPAGRADELCARLQELSPSELAPTPGDDPAVAWIAARDGAWTPKQFVDCVTDLLEAGELGCVVGTRGLLAEGWDAPSLNVLVDLTTATTPQTVQQLRGRTIRLDPDDPEKLAHNWDVVAYAPRIARGDNDLRRFLRRHEHTWGIVLGREYERARDSLELADDAELPVPIEKGPRHVDPDLVAELERIDAATDAPREADRLRQDALEEATERSAAAVPRRAAARAAWAIGGPSDVFATESTRVRLEEPVTTVSYVATTTRALLYALVTTFAVGAGLALAYGGGLVQSREGALVLLAGAFVSGLLLSAGLLLRTLRRLFVERPTDVIVLDIGRAVALALADAELIAMNRDTVLRSVWCRETPERELAVGLTGAPEDQRTFTIALREVFTVTGETRYLIRRTDSRLPGFLSNVLWALLRRFPARLGAGATKDHFLAVPRVLGRSRKRAETFARHWSRLVGGGELVDTRDPEAATAILEARSTSRLRAVAQRLESFGSIRA